MIRWITNYLGTAPWRNAKDTPNVEILDVRDLIDDDGNSSKLVAEKIKEGIEVVQKQKKLVVCCEYGMSRSNAIAVGIICSIEKITFNQGLKLVINSTKETQIKLSVLKVVNKITGDNRTLSDEMDEKILVIDYDDYVGKSIAKLLDAEKFILINNKSEPSELFKNPALLYLFIVENNITKIVFISCEGVINTNQFIGNLLFVVKNILDVSIATDCSLFFISTIDVFLGYKKKTLTIKASTRKKPDGNRGIAYSFAEDLISLYQKDYKLNVAILRMPIIYGEHLTKPYFLANFIRKAQSDTEIKTHRYINNLAWVNLVHVNDSAKFILKVIEKEKFGIYNIDGGEKLNTYDISKIILKIYASSSKLTSIKLEKKLVKINIDIKQLTEKIGWQPQENFYKTIKNKIYAKTSN